ncbi:MBL fold metallo-hydrolase [Nostoc sp. CCY 9925]|uniref:MBL fold metallo-hydrolase n=1 Tax=Nostoc sp. CCY 9925 TaxID=3103865 RepID=UPI0039C61422
MKNDNVYLKQNVLIEPLFNKWYAWTYLISPATSSMYMANSHLKIMQSFIASPKLHMSALNNPAMIGGSFISYKADRVNEIKALLEKTNKEQAQMLKLAEAIKTLTQMLTEQANGYSLEPLYQNIPKILKGYVELVYDLDNNPSIRFIEGLLYKSKYYDQSLQTVALSLIEQDSRPFVLSTPRLMNDQCLHLNFPFSSGELDILFKMKEFPNSLSHIKEVLGIQNKDNILFSSFFTKEPYKKYSKYSDCSIRIRYFGHACILIETKYLSILCDPLVSYKHDNSELYRYTYSDLPNKIDYVLITHNHQDHCVFETLLQLRHKIVNLVIPKSNNGVLADPSLKLILQNIGFNNITEIDEIESIIIPEGYIVSLPFFGEHADLNIRTKTAYLISIEGKSILCASDSNNIEPQLYEHIYEIVGDIDIIFLGMECDGAPLSWLYGSLLTKTFARKIDQTRRLDGSDCEKGIKLINQFNPKEVYVYAMGQEPWLTHLTSVQYNEKSRPVVESNKLIEECKKRNITSERLFGHKEIFLGS